MKKFVRIIDEKGIFIEDAFVDELTEFTIEEPCKGGFILPKWDGKKWIEGGEKSIEITIPNSLTSRQLRMQLVLMGVDLSIIDSVIDSLSEPQKSLAKITWEYAGTFERDNGMMQEMIPMLGFSEEQINEIFIEGNKL